MKYFHVKYRKKLLKYINRIISIAGIKIIIDDNPYPIEIKPENKKLIEFAKLNGMSSNIRFVELINSVDYILKNKIKGDFVECGVWRGANLVVMQKLLERNRISNIKVYGFDTFEGMSEPTEYDYDYMGNSAKDAMKKPKKEGRGIWAYSTYERARNYCDNSVDQPENIIFVKGKVEETLIKQENLPNSISLLRLDTDFYESTKIELEVLFPLLTKGGVLIIDDYGHFRGSQKAVDEYFKNQNIWLKYVDYSCRLYVKD